MKRISTSSLPGSQVGSSRLGQPSLPMSDKSDIGTRQSMKRRSELNLSIDHRVKPGGDERGNADTLSNSVKHGHMVSCWQNGRRVLMHSSEVARMMKKEASSKPTPSCRASTPLSVGTSERVDARDQRGHDENERAKQTYDLTPPPLVPRSHTLAGHEIWQKLAKEMVRVVGHPKHCHKSSCRRAKQCAGGQDACYLREFETVDVVMQRFLQSHARELRAAAQEGAGPAERDGAKP
ncbi:MAG: hypothetical protein KIT15_14280 [Xanthobacteraceae bacterium]|nr:hypothetical protein [Xanthobacteraceae bacterium]